MDILFLPFPPFPVHRNVLPTFLPSSQSQAARQFSFKSIPLRRRRLSLWTSTQIPHAEFPMRFNKQKGDFNAMDRWRPRRGRITSCSLHLEISPVVKMSFKKFCNKQRTQGQKDWEVPCASKKSENCAYCLPLPACLSLKGCKCNPRGVPLFYPT